MRIHAAPAATAAVVLLAACASSSAPAKSTAEAELACRSFVVQEGLIVSRVGQAAAVDGGFRVPVRVEDRLGRRIDNACVIAGNQTRWANPLPDGIALN
jgi:hypothetical protein